MKLFNYYQEGLHLIQSQQVTLHVFKQALFLWYSSGSFPIRGFRFSKITNNPFSSNGRQLRYILFIPIYTNEKKQRIYYADV
jgi:hypothetical protein